MAAVLLSDQVPNSGHGLYPMMGNECHEEALACECRHGVVTRNLSSAPLLRDQVLAAAQELGRPRHSGPFSILGRGKSKLPNYWS